MGRRVAALGTWLALATLLAAPAARAQSELAIARERFERGADLFAHEQYAEALEEYRASLAAYASPNSRLAIARCLERLGRGDEAVAEYELAARDAADRAGSDPRYANTRETAEAELARLEPRVARLRVRATNAGAQTRVTVRDRALPSGALGLSVPVLPGAADVLVESPGFRPARRSVVLEAGHETTLDVTLEPAPVPRPAVLVETPAPRVRRGRGPSGALRVAAWTALVVGGAGLAAWGGLGLWANGEYAALEQACGPLDCPSDRQGEVTLGETLQVLTNVSLGVGVAGATAALAFGLALAATDARPRTARVACAGAWCGAAIAF